jgi:hypothetical protein
MPRTNWCFGAAAPQARVDMHTMSCTNNFRFEQRSGKATEQRRAPIAIAMIDGFVASVHAQGPACPKLHR